MPRTKHTAFIHAYHFNREIDDDTAVIAKILSDKVTTPRPGLAPRAFAGLNPSKLREEVNMC